MQVFPVEQAIRAQRALREAAGMEPEQFPIGAFVGMISDEVEQLRDIGKSDQDIADLIEASSSIRITASQIAENYASPEERHQERHAASGE